MATRFTVAPGNEFNYPSINDAKIIKAAGGRSKMRPEALALMKFKTVTEGQDCSDMPKDALDLYLERGWVIATEETIAPVEETIHEDKGDG